MDVIQDFTTIRIFYPSGTCTEGVARPKAFNREHGTLAIETEDGEIVLLDPRAIITNIDGKILWNARAQINELPLWVQQWFSEHPEWGQEVPPWSVSVEWDKFLQQGERVKPVVHGVDSVIAGGEYQLTPARALHVVEVVIEHLRRFPDVCRAAATWALCSEARAENLIQVLLRHLTTPDLLIWGRDPWNASQSGYEVFHHMPLTEPQARIEPQVWVWDFALEYPENAEDCEKMGLNQRALPIMGCLLPMVGVNDETGLRDGQLANLPEHDVRRSGRDGVTWLFVYTEEKTRCPIIRALPFLGVGGPIFSIYASIIAARAFLQTKIVTAEPVQLQRAERRRREREKRPLPRLQRVVLRRAANHETNGGSSHGTVDWSCQWMVRGHWRIRPHKATGEPRAYYVSPHIKGPSDKPFRAPRQRFFDVRR